MLSATMWNSFIKQHIFTPFGWLPFSVVMSTTLADRILTSGFFSQIQVGAKLNLDKILRYMVKTSDICFYE